MNNKKGWLREPSFLLCVDLFWEQIDHIHGEMDGVELDHDTVHDFADLQPEGDLYKGILRFFKHFFKDLDALYINAVGLRRGNIHITF